MNNNSRTAIALLAVGLVVAAVSSLTPSQASAQEAKLMYACYMQGSGVVYRINPPDDPGQDPKLKDDCTGKKHVKFYWVEFVGADGKVGIGVPEPTAELDVAGDIHASGQLRLGDHTITIDPVTNTITSGPDEDIYILPGLPGTAGKVGIGTVEPDERLTVAGTVESTDGGFKFPDGSVQTTAITGGSGGTLEHGSLLGLDEDDHEQYVLVDGARWATDGFAILGTYGTGSLPLQGKAGPHLMWYPGKGAFRVGAARVNWDHEQVGSYSTGVGRGIARGDVSTGMGQGIANGDYSTAMGEARADGELSTAMGFSRAIGLGSTAMGDDAEAIGQWSTVMGIGTSAQAYASLVLGKYNVIDGTTDAWQDGDPVLVVGNGAGSQRSNAFTLFKNGNLTIAGLLTEESDARFKSDIRPLGSVLQKLEEIRGVTFRFTNEQSNPSGLHIGLLAQEVQQAFPELVHEDRNGKLSVAYGNLTAVLLEGIKEQQRENEQLRARIADLESAILRLETAVSAREK